MLFWILLIVIIFLFLIVFFRTLRFKVPSTSIAKSPPKVTLPDDALQRLSGALQIETISYSDYTKIDFSKFQSFIDYLKESFPLFHKTCTLERINTYGLVYCWKGTDSSLSPMMFTAHYDVVPIENGTESDWTYPPFSGKIIDGRIWGRGTLDIKSQLIAHLEASETLMKNGFTPQRDYFFVYGFDEEIGGAKGAQEIAQTFLQRGYQFEGILDEGGVAIQDAMPGLDVPLALIGIAEKGYCDFELTVTGSGGHSSMPPSHTALGDLAKVIHAIEDNPMPSRLTSPVEKMLSNVAGDMGFPVRMAMANLWLFKPLLLHILTKTPTTAAMIRSTFAPTMATASESPNALPQKAVGVVNVRLLPGDTSDSVATYFQALGQKEKVSIRKLQVDEPTDISPTTGRAYTQLLKCIKTVYPETIPTPYLVMGGTDARKYSDMSKYIYRFTPVLITDAEKETMHSTNESISIENYARMVHFFQRYMEEFDSE